MEKKKQAPIINCNPKYKNTTNIRSQNMGTGHYFWALFYFASLCSASLANNAKINFREKEKKVLDQILGAGKYDARIRPSGINGTVNLSIKRISNKNHTPTNH
ncbi:hypothetical protein GQX74_013782 [Glossina fuscipes]|nr:hypothetical protein GQX74_013782 [Glossina fuscipes]